MVKSTVKVIFLSVSAVGLSAAPTFAQDNQTTVSGPEYFDRNKYVAVTDRSQPDFDPVPMRWGSFFVQPTLAVGLASDSNLFASEQNEESDVVAHIGASLDARSNWNNNELGFVLSGRQNEYLDFGSESNFDFRSKVHGRIDVSRAVALRGEAYYENRTEERTQIANSVSNVDPIQFDVIGGKVGASYQNDRVRLSADVRVEERDFEDGRDVSGLEFDQDYRDRTATIGTVNASYAVTPNVAVFAQGKTINRDYATQTNFGGTPFNRDSNGYEVQGGFDFELTALLRGKFGIGYLEESRDDPQFQDIDGLSVDGLVQWFPSQIVTVTATASRRSEDQGLIEVPSAISTRFGVQADYELRRNVILSAAGEVGGLDFDEIDRNDDFSTVSLSAKYKINRRVHVDAFAKNIDRDTDGFAAIVGQSFTKNVIGIGLNFFTF